jgi:putative oxidoreductase
VSDRTRLTISLLSLRIGVAIVMGIWALDKIVKPEHASRVFENFYGISGLGRGAFLSLGLAQLLLVGAFVAGISKRLTYGAVLVLHAISTFSSYQQYLDPFSNLLFFAAWPMLAACLSLYLLRDRDTLWTAGRS